MSMSSKSSTLEAFVQWSHPDWDQKRIAGAVLEMKSTSAGVGLEQTLASSRHQETSPATVSKVMKASQKANMNLQSFDPNVAVRSVAGWNDAVFSNDSKLGGSKAGATSLFVHYGHPEHNKLAASQTKISWNEYEELSNYAAQHGLPAVSQFPQPRLMAMRSGGKITLVPTSLLSNL